MLEYVTSNATISAIGLQSGVTRISAGKPSESTDTVRFAEAVVEYKIDSNHKNLQRSFSEGNQNYSVNRSEDRLYIHEHAPEQVRDKFLQSDFVSQTTRLNTSKASVTPEDRVSVLPTRVTGHTTNVEYVTLSKGFLPNTAIIYNEKQNVVVNLSGERITVQPDESEERTLPSRTVDAKTVKITDEPAPSTPQFKANGFIKEYGRKMISVTPVLTIENYAQLEVIQK